MKLKSPFALLLSTLLLQGCIAGVVISGAAIATKSMTDPRSIGTQIDDRTLQARVNNSLSKDLYLKNETRVVSIAYQGKILLMGQAPNIDISRHAKQIASRIAGVREVYNEIRIGKPIHPSVVYSDAWITTKVHLQILINNTVKSTDIKVITENSEVFLLGLVTQEEAYIAAKIASQISNVKHVITIFDYVK